MQVLLSYWERVFIFSLCPLLHVSTHANSKKSISKNARAVLITLLLLHLLLVI